MCFPQKYVKSRKICSKLDIKIALPSKYSKTRPKLYYRIKRKNRKTEKGFTLNTMLSQLFKSCKLYISK